MRQQPRVAINESNRDIVKWVNGIWTIFDRLEFKNLTPCLGTEKNAERLLKEGRKK